MKMQIIEITPKNIYTCQFCGKDFETPKEEYINLGFNPVCSNRCKFRLIFNLFKKFNLSKENLLVLAKNNDVKLDYSKEKDFEPNFLTFELTKKVINKVHLPTIKDDLLKLVQVLVQKKLVQESELEFWFKKLVQVHSLYNKEWTSFEPEPVLSIEPELTKRRVLNKWIK
jgi:hypothetical protein